MSTKVTKTKFPSKVMEVIAGNRFTTQVTSLSQGYSEIDTLCSVRATHEHNTLLPADYINFKEYGTSTYDL